MLSKKHYPDWIVLISVGVVLMFLYGFDIKELAKRILEWTFVAIGYRLLIEYGALEKLSLRFKKER